MEHSLTNRLTTAARGRRGLSRQQRDRFDFQQCALACECRHLNCRSRGRRRRVDVAVAYFTEGVQVCLHIDKVVVELDHMSDACADEAQRSVEILEYLHALSTEIGPDYAVTILAQLAGYEDKPAGADRLDDVGIAGRLRQRWEVVEARVRHLMSLSRP